MVNWIIAVAILCLMFLLAVLVGKIAKGPRWHSETQNMATKEQWRTNQTYLDHEGNAWVVISSTPNEDGSFDTVMGKE